MKTPEDYLKAPYSRVLIPDMEEGGFTAQILEFPGCLAEGETPDEAYKNLEVTAKGWINAALEMGQTIPEPLSENIYSGKISLRTSRSLHRDAAKFADRDRVSLNQYICMAIAEKVGSSKAYASTERHSINQVMPHTMRDMVIAATLSQSGYPLQISNFTIVRDVVGNITATASTSAMDDAPFNIGPMLKQMEQRKHG